MNVSFENVKLNIKNNKNYLFTLLMIVIFTIFLFLVLFGIIFGITIYNLTVKDFEARIINVSSNKVTALENDIRANKHINMYNKVKYKINALTLNNLGTVRLEALSDKEVTKLNVINGKKDLDKNNIICPEKLVISPHPTKEDNEDVTFFTKNLIDNEYSAKISIEETSLVNGKYESKEIASNIRNFKITGSYDNTAYNTDYSTCFASVETMENMYIFDGEDYSSYQTKDNPYYVDEYYVVVDNVKNVNSVLNYLQSLGYSPYKVFELDYGVMAIIIITIFVLFCIILASISMTVNFVIKRNIINREKELLVYKSIGYDNVRIKNIYITEYFILLVIAYVIAIILYLIIFYMIYSKYNLIFEENLLPFKMYKSVFVIVFFVGVLYSELIINSRVKYILD